MSNFEVVVEARSQEALLLALQLVRLGNSAFVAWREAGGSDAAKALELYWAKPPSPAPEVQMFMAPLDAAGVLSNVLQWLQTAVPPGVEPDIDGSVSKGFRLTARQSGWSYVACRIEPVWALHGK